MPLVTIPHRRTGADLFITDAPSLREALHIALAAHVNLTGAILRGAYLERADLTGANLEDADLTGAILRGAYLERADLTGANLEDADLTGAILRGAYLERADLTDADLTGADLTGAVLMGADLTGAVLRGARVLAGEELPVVAQLDQAILAALEDGGTLDMDTWHTCATTHCRAGWAITLAGAPGQRLEASVGPETAGALIYHASAGYVPDFYASEAETLADLRAHASA